MSIAVISTSGIILYQIKFEIIIEADAEPVMDDAINDIQLEIMDILEQGKDDIVNDARANAPVKTGALRNSIFGDVVETDGLLLGAMISYAAFQEYGTSKMAAHPFLGPAIDEHQPMIQEEIDNSIAERLGQDMSEDDPELEFSVEMGDQ